MFIECELYNLAYNKTPGLLYEYQFISAKMGKWDDYFTFTKYLLTKAFDYM